ncbi:MAG: hypothetical protein R2800_05445 [Flavipsychrobacter sp.]
MQTNIAKKYSITCKVLFTALFLLIVGATQSSNLKKSLVYDDVTAEFVADLDIENDDDNSTLNYLDLLPTYYTVYHETPEHCQNIVTETDDKPNYCSDKLYILFHRLKLDTV